jgi:hypothetical protein
MRATTAILLIVGALAASETALADPIPVAPPLVGLPDLTVHDLYTNGLDPGLPVSAFLARGQEALWTVTVTNSSNSNWTDFHMEVPSQLSGVNFVPNVQVTKWGSLGPQNFMLSGGFFGLTLADFKAPAGQVVAPGSTIGLTIPVVNNNATFGVRYHVTLRATAVPEPSTLLLLGSGLLGTLPLRHKLRRKRCD